MITTAAARRTVHRTGSAKSGPPADRPAASVATGDYAELIAASPAVGFLPKTAPSARAIQDLLDATAT